MTLPVGGIAGFLELQGAAAFEQGILGAQRSLSLTGESATVAAAAVDKVDIALARTAPATSSAASGTAKLRAAQLSAVAATERYNMVLGQEDASLARLASSEASMIRANERLAASSPAAAMRATTVAAEEQAGALSGARAGLGGFAESAAKLGLAFGGFEIAKKAFEFVGAGKQLTDSLNAVQAASRATDEQMVAVRAEAIALGKDLTIPAATAIDAADAVLELVKAGIKLPRAIEAARPALLLASATQSNMADTAKVLGDTMDIFSIKGTGAAHAANIIGASVLGASHDLLGFFDEMKQAGPSAQAMKVNLDDLSTTLVYLAKHGLSMSMGGAAVKTFLTNLTKDTPKGVAALKDLGVEAFDAQGRFVGFPKVFDQLHASYVRFGPDSKRFLGDLNAAFGVRSQSAAALFGKTTGKALDEIHARLESGDLQKFANTMNRGVGAEMRQLGKEATAAGIDLYQKFEKPTASTVTLLAELLPAALHTAAAALAPFAAGWHAVDAVLGPVVHGLEDGLAALSPVLPVVKFLATDLLTLWLAFKGYTIAYAAFNALQDGFLAMKAKSAAGLAAVREFGTGTSSSMSLSAATVREGSGVMQAEFDKIAASALGSAAAVDRAAAVEATAYADMIAASKTASDAQVLAAERAATAANVQARASALAAGETAAAAEASASAVAVAGEEAAIGWSGLLGPLAAVGIGIGLLVTMFHKSDSASKDAAAAAKAYTDALAGGSDKTTIFDSIVSQLKDSNVPQLIEEFNKAIGHTAVTAPQFASAIEQGGKPLADLKKRLKDLASEAGNPLLTGHLFKILTEQAAGFSSAVKKDLADTKAFAGVSASVDRVGTSFRITSDSARRYATMAGFIVDKNGVVANSANQVKAAIGTISGAYNTASSSVRGLLDADQTFSTSAGTAADRAALIGATLKAANGDALAFAGAMAGTTTAVDGLTSAFQQQAQQLQQQSADQEKAARSSESAQARLVAAQARLNEVRAKSTSTAAQVKAAEASVASAQAAASNATASAAKSDALAYADTERAAIRFRKTQDGLKASIDTTAKGAGDLVSQLQGIQSAAMAAASAEFQHEGATKKAADDAYNIYVSKTKASLIDSRKELGLTRAQAKALATQYFGMPKHVKTLIEAEGTNPILTVLNKIGKLLAALTGQKWNMTVGVTVQDKKLRDLIKNDPTLGASVNANGVTHLPGGGGFASGGPINGSGPKGVDSVGLIGAPGEWMMRASAVDKYGPAFMAAVNAGTFRMSGGGSSVGGGETHVHHHKHLRIDSVQLGPIHYPEREKDTTVLPRLARQAGEQIASYL